MPCTTVLVGRKASNDGSTIIGRTDDGHFDVKKMVVVDPKTVKRTYTSKIEHLTIELPEYPMRYTACPSVSEEKGVWAASGINAANVAITATETITTNPRVQGADPLVKYQPKKGRNTKEVPGGISEEDIVTVVLPYIKSAKEGVKRLAGLIEKYGTSEMNGIAFSDEKDIWWMETIGGHHWIARRVPEDRVVIMPNQFGMDEFDFNDAFGKKKDFMCSADLKEFVRDNFLDLNNDGNFNPRNVFGSRRDHDHVYNTPRAWSMGRYLCPTSIDWDGPDADYTPESDDIPWSFVPERKLAPEDVKTMLSLHFQGTPYDPYSASAEKKGIYRSIGINRTGVTPICQIRGYMPDELKGVEWICFASSTFAASLPVYTNVSKLPKYLTDVTLDVTTENFHWASRLLGCLADPCFGESILAVQRYQEGIASQGRRIMNEYDKKMAASLKFDLLEEANEKLCEMARKETTEVLNEVVGISAARMKNGYNRSDN